MKGKVTILVIDPCSGSEAKTFLVPRFLIRNWYSVLSISFLFILSFFSLIVITTMSGSYGTSSMMNKKPAQHSKKTIPDPDIKQLRKSLRSIDSCVLKINRFMDLRGIDDFNLEPIGYRNQEDTEDMKDLSTTAEAYSKLIGQLEQKLRILPLGRPHPGARSSGFGTRKNPFGINNTEGHKGIDFQGSMGSLVRATAGGKVIYASLKGGYGNCVVIRHGLEFKTLYGHLSVINVEKGERVEPGTIIGRVGSTGRSTGPHLHYEIIHKEKKINPQEYLSL